MWWWEDPVFPPQLLPGHLCETYPVLTRFPRWTKERPIPKAINGNKREKGTEDREKPKDKEKPVDKEKQNKKRTRKKRTRKEANPEVKEDLKGRANPKEKEKLK